VEKNMAANIIEVLEKEQLEKITAGKRLDSFAAGDTVRVNVKIIEGSNERIQAFEGICIAKKNRGINSSFTVRKLSHGEGVERIFPLFSPRIESIERVRRGDVRRAKLYYLRGLTGKAARIREKMDFNRGATAATAAK
jgi:large subunit ribosomal protein L19